VQQQQLLADASIQLEKSKMLPDLSLAYYNTSMIGTGADEKVYSASKRFSSVQVGLGIPLFYGAQKAKINTAKFNKTIAESNYSIMVQTMQSEYQVALAQYNKYAQAVQYFESIALKNSLLITSTADLQLASGGINYMEWVHLVNQAIAVKNDYVEAVKGLNDSIIRLNYLTNQ
jgi:cobalt-zinc-cadmium resistance protein CzcA